MKPNIQKLYSKTEKTRIILTISLVLLGLISSQIILATAAQASSQYDLTIRKTVRNLTSGQGYFSENINASNNNRLMFQIQIQNTGEATLNNVIVHDTLPSYISYIYGTARLDDGAIASDTIISSGINIGSIYSGSSRVVTFEALINYPGTSQSLTLTNRAYSHADQTSEDNDSATIYVTQATIASNLNISQSVRNSTSGQTSFSPSVNANAGDHIIFLIELTTPANAPAITNVRLWDILPAGLNYITGSSRVDGNYASDGIVSNGINLGAIYPNQGHRINFEATANPNYSGTQTTLTNYAYVSGDSVYQRSASTQIIVSPTATISSNSNVSSQGTNSSNIVSPVAAVSGTNSWIANFVLSFIITLWAVFALYLLIEYADFWRNLRLKLAILKARMKK